MSPDFPVLVWRKVDFLFTVIKNTESSLKAGGYVQGAERRQGGTVIVAWGVTSSSASSLQGRNCKSYNKFHKVKEQKEHGLDVCLERKLRPLSFIRLNNATLPVAKESQVF